MKQATIDTVQTTIISRPVQCEDYKRIRRWEDKCGYDEKETGNPDGHNNSQFLNTRKKIEPKIRGDVPKADSQYSS